MALTITELINSNATLELKHLNTNIAISLYNIKFKIVNT